jgi:hypothetical protein
VNRIRITHVIADDSSDRADAVLRCLVTRTDGAAFCHCVIRLMEKSVPAADAALPNGVVRVPAGIELISEIRRTRPHLVQTWTHRADLIGGAVARLFARVPVIWSLRPNGIDARGGATEKDRSAGLCAGLSNRLPHAIVCRSHEARDTYVTFGYQADRMVVIPDGNDMETSEGGNDEGHARGLMVQHYEELYRRVFSQRYS